MPMSDEDRSRWDARYADGAYESRLHPSALLAMWLPRLPRGRALDVACGRGRNALFLAAAGFAVDAIDVSPVAIRLAADAARAAGLDVRFRLHDLDAPMPGDDLWDLVVITRYLNLPRVVELGTRLTSGGVLLCEVLLAVDAPTSGPRERRFRAAPGALRAAVSAQRAGHSPLSVLDYMEGEITDPDGTRVAVARAVARRD